MKLCHIGLAALVLLGSPLCVNAQDKPDRTIVLACSTRLPVMADIVHAIEISDYWAPVNVRRKILSLAREACAQRPTAVLAFVPRESQAPVASK
jgi:hypothetical protein